MRVLFLGKRWYGSCARACCEALRRLGHDVSDITEEDYGLKASSTTARIIARLLAPISIREYNLGILRSAQSFKPDFVLAFKGVGVTAETLKILRAWGVATYNYYPDRVSMITDRSVMDALGEYDCVFDTKSTWDASVSPHVRFRERVVLSHGYDSELHHPLVLDEGDQQVYGCDVGYVGNHMPRKERILLELAELRPNLDLRIWGHRWLKADRRLHRYVAGPAITGKEYVRAVSGSRVSLAIMGINESSVDETTTRTFEIPACGRFMLHERTPEVLELFDEGKEIACFCSPKELAEKIDYYLSHPEERVAIAKRGNERCVPAYSYEARVQQVVSWHLDNSKEKRRKAAGAL